MTCELIFVVSKAFRGRGFAIVALVLACCVLGSSSYAEVIDLEGTVKSVDAESRTICIERKTPKGTKTLELEVTKKAGDLSAIKAGDKISFSYDPDLEVVTKIDSGKVAAITGTEKAAEVFRITYTYSVDGSTKTTVRVLGAGEDEGESSKKEEVKPGVWRATHVFDDADEVSKLQGPLLDMTGVTFDAARKALFVNPKQGGEDKTAMQYPSRFRLPMTVELDAMPASERVVLQITPNANNMQNLHPFATISTEDGFRTVEVIDRWVVARNPKSGQPEIKDVAGKRKASTSEEVTIEGKSPVAINPEELYLVRLGAFTGDPTSGKGYYIRRLSIEARFVPTLGLALQQDGDIIRAKDVLKKSPAEAAGLKAGDIVVSIDGKKPSTLQRAMQLLSMTNYGESWNIEVERDGVQKAFTIKAE
jgi:hypothetical protein